jgi:hypothetical protein
MLTDKVGQAANLCEIRLPPVKRHHLPHTRQGSTQGLAKLARGPQKQHFHDISLTRPVP